MDNYQITFNTWNELAPWYEEIFMHLDIYNHTYDAFCQAIQTEKPNVLELGCGPGNISKYILNKRPDINLLGTDVSSNMLTFARKNNPMAEFKLLDIRQLDSMKQKFDALMIGFCLPYLSKEDFTKLLHDSYAVLNNKGIIYLSCIEGDYEQSGMITNGRGSQTLMFYYDLPYLIKTLEHFHFTLIQKYTVPYTVQPEKTTSHLILIASK